MEYTRQILSNAFRGGMSGANPANVSHTILPCSIQGIACRQGSGTLVTRGSEGMHRVVFPPPRFFFRSAPLFLKNAPYAPYLRDRIEMGIFS